MMEYQEFLRSKSIYRTPSGMEPRLPLNPMLFGFQADIVKWALRQGKAAIWADCGTGKGPMQLEWCRQQPHESLIVAPLAVSKQFLHEAEKFGVELTYARNQSEVKSRLTITNYQRIEGFDPSKFGAISLDESSILKAIDGHTRKYITSAFADVPFRLASSATPAPNDQMEIGSHSEFMGLLSRSEMLSTFFVHDGGDTSQWRLKGHAETEFWKWVCSWAVMLRRPSDLGYSDDGFILPNLNLVHHVIKSDGPMDGQLFTVEARTLNERRQARRDSLSERVARCVDLVATKPHEPWMIWVDLNDEGDAVEKLIPDAVQVAGRHDDATKEDRMMGFTEGRYRVLVSKSSIAGYGMNWQHCWNVVYLGLSDSWEKYYQSIRRFWRFGQTHEVDCHIITSEAEGAVVKNIERKETDALRMAREMVQHMSVYNKAALHSLSSRSEYNPTVEMSTPSWLKTEVAENPQP